MKALAVEGKRIGKVSFVYLCVKRYIKILTNVVHKYSKGFFRKSHNIWPQVLDYAIEADQLIDKYETLASELLQWIEQTIGTLNDRQLANSLNAVQNQLQAFNSYRTVEKPPKWVQAEIPSFFFLDI